ncbi:MAG: hypothetical protein B0D92_01825 [Spirochaeta sp. LUC14_002_19_P3]|nr:MAG: hypothetical protein B0D92_01825 [Spirochaeta sp. LUC14_002_19_P3]
MSRPNPPRRETELYPPLKAWLETQGYQVRGEVKKCDLAAVRDGELIAIELKIRPSLALLAQAAERQDYADSVYVALPLTPVSRGFRLLLRRLGIGLIFIHFLRTKIKVEVAYQPGAEELPPRRRPKKKAALLREISGRDMDLSPGGLAGGKPRVSAYRQQSLRLAAWLAELGTASPAQLVKLGARGDAGRMLSRNIYGWFERVSRGCYCLHPSGRKALNDAPRLRALYHAQLREAVGKTI